MKLNRRRVLSGLGLGLAAPFVRPSYAAGGSLNVYNWADNLGNFTSNCHYISIL